jgi:hypothetical protein
MAFNWEEMHMGLIECCQELRVLKSKMKGVKMEKLRVGMKVKTNGNGFHVMENSITGEVVEIDTENGYFLVKRDDGLWGLGKGGTWMISLTNTKAKTMEVL